MRRCALWLKLRGFKVQLNLISEHGERAQGNVRFDLGMHSYDLPGASAVLLMSFFFSLQNGGFIFSIFFECAHAKFPIFPST